MPYINDIVFDNGLSQITANVTTLFICSAEPTTYAQASSTFKLGTKTSFTCPSPSNAGTGTGRRIACPAVSSGGTIDSSGTATHWAICSGSVLYAAGPLSASQVVTAGNSFTLTTFDVIIRDPT